MNDPVDVLVRLIGVVREQHITCPFCDAVQDESEVHDLDCIVAEAIEAVEACQEVE